MTRTPLSRSEGQGHQAASLTAAFTRQAAAAVAVGTYSPWEPTDALRFAGSAAQGASAPTEGGEGQRHIVAAARQQLVNIITVLQNKGSEPVPYTAPRCS